MALRRKVEHRAGLVGSQKLGHQSRVTKIAMHKHVARIAGQRGQVLQVTGVGEFVQVHHRLLRECQPVEHKIAANEAGAAGDQNCHEVGSLLPMKLGRLSPKPAAPQRPKTLGKNSHLRPSDGRKWLLLL